MTTETSSLLVRVLGKCANADALVLGWLPTIRPRMSLGRLPSPLRTFDYTPDLSRFRFWFRCPTWLILVFKLSADFGDRVAEVVG